MDLPVGAGYPRTVDQADRVVVPAVVASLDHVQCDEQARLAAERRESLDRATGLLDCTRRGRPKGQRERGLERVAVVGAGAELDRRQDDDALRRLLDDLDRKLGV